MRQLKLQSNNNIRLNITSYRHEIIIKIKNKKKRITMLIVKWESVVLEIMEAAKILDSVKLIHL